jgi:hypothetical protein
VPVQQVVKLAVLAVLEQLGQYAVVEVVYRYFGSSLVDYLSMISVDFGIVEIEKPSPFAG